MKGPETLLVSRRLEPESVRLSRTHEGIISMHKKLMLACMAIAAFAAFVVAPSASATTLQEGGSAVAVGSSITGKNVNGNTKFTSNLFNVECTTAHLKGTVTQNNGTGEIKGEVPLGSASFTNAGGECSSGAGATAVTVNSKICLETSTSGGADNLKVTGCGGNIKFSLNVTGLATCNYSQASLTGTFVTGGDAVGTLTEAAAAREGTNFLCPSTGKLDMSIELTTTSGATLSIVSGT